MNIFEASCVCAICIKLNSPNIFFAKKLYNKKYCTYPTNFGTVIFFLEDFSTVWDFRVWMSRVTWFVSWMPRPGRNAFLWWWCPCGPCGPCGGHQWRSSAGVEAKCHTSRSVVAEKESTSMIRYKYVVAVAVAVAQGTEK